MIKYIETSTSLVILDNQKQILKTEPYYDDVKNWLKSPSAVIDDYNLVIPNMNYCDDEIEIEPDNIYYRGKNIEISEESSGIFLNLLQNKTCFTKESMVKLFKNILSNPELSWKEFWNVIKGANYSFTSDGLLFTCIQKQISLFQKNGNLFFTGNEANIVLVNPRDVRGGGIVKNYIYVDNWCLGNQVEIMEIFEYMPCISDNYIKNFNQRVYDIISFFRNKGSEDFKHFIFNFENQFNVVLPAAVRSLIIENHPMIEYKVFNYMASLK